MEAFNEPLRELADQVGGFFFSSHHRLLQVVADQHLREAALEIVMAQEYHASNKSPFVRLDAPFTDEDHGWEQRIASLREQHAERRAGMARHGYDLPELGPAAQAEAGEPLARFSYQVQQLLQARCEPLSGLVVVMAPTIVEHPKPWSRAVRSLFLDPKFVSVRWVVVDLERSSLSTLLEELGDSAVKVECRLDERAVQREMGQRIEAASVASLESPGLAQSGAAWPRGADPPSRTKRPPLGPEQRRELAERHGVPEALFETPIREVRPLALKAAQALRSGDAIAAVRFQSAAVERCMTAGLAREALVLELMLATYVLHAGDRSAAIGRYETCAERARENGWADLEAQSLMGAAALNLLARNRDRASVLYGEAGQAARDGGEAALAIEGYRMAGQIRAEAGDEEMALKLWTEALAIAKKMEPAEAGQTSAPLAGRQLAEVCRDMGLSEQAASLEAQVACMEGR